MADPALPDAFKNAVRKLEEYFKKEMAGDISSMSPEHLLLFKGRGIVQGWQLNFSLRGSIVEKLFLMVDRRFPFTTVKTAVFPAPPMLVLPHIDEDGWVCIDEDNATSWTPDDPVLSVIVTLQEIQKLQKEIFDNPAEAANEFRREFLSYWIRSLKTTNKPTATITSLLSPEMESGAIWLNKNSAQWIAGPTKNAIDAWRKARGEKHGDYQQGFFLKSKEPPLPSKYPQKNEDIASLDGFTSAVIEEFCETFANLPDEIDIVIAYETENGKALVGLTINKNAYGGKFFKGGDSALRRALREKKVPLTHVVDRYFGDSANEIVVRRQVTRADHSWVYGRDNNPEATTLSSKKVALVGLGSLGSMVAEQLAKAGVGSFVMIDPQRLSWENISRHALDARFIGQFKSSALKISLEAGYPLLGSQTSCETTWEEAFAKNDKIFYDCDLIIHTTGSYDAGGAHLSLNRLAQSLNLPPILYGWTEPFAAAGHAVLLRSGGACLECHFQNGRYIHAITDFAQPLRNTPSCGEAFQPYGVVEFTNSVTMISGVAIAALLGNADSGLHRIWIGSEDILRNNGGQWAEEYARVSNGHSRLGFYWEGNWARSQECQVCSKQGEDLDGVLTGSK